MATIKSKQLNPNLTGSFAVSGSFDVTGPLTATTFIGMLSSSAQIADNISGSWQGALGSTPGDVADGAAVQISGSFTSVSESLAARISSATADNITGVTAGTGLSGGGSTGDITLNVDFTELTDETPTFAGLTIEGDLTARSYIVSSSVTHLTQSFSSGSTIFGDSLDDRHEFTGSLIVSSSNLTIDNSGGISGSSVSTGSFGRVEAAGVVFADQFQSVTGGNTIDFNDDVDISGTLTAGTITGMLSSSAQISSDISGSFTAPSASISDRLTTAESELSNTLISSSAQIATDISGSLGENADLIRSLTAQTISGSAGYTSTLTAAGISGSFQHGGFEFSVVSGSATSTGSFGRVEVDVIEAKRFVVSSSVSNITTVDISGSTQFGDTADDRHQFTGSIFIQSGSISQELYAVTNNDRMFFGRYTGGIPVSGSSNMSRFATDSEGNTVDLGFTSLDDDGNLVLTTVGDGLHVDDVNYWYNNKLFRMGKGAELDGPNFRGLNSEYIHFDTNNIKVKGDLIATTGSFQGEMYVKSPDNKSMYIGKSSTGIPVSGSSNMSRYVTGSDGNILDIGFTTVDESGEVVFTTAGDGIYVDGNNYWYTTGHFKVGDSNNFINWNTSNLNISGTFTGDGSGLTGVSGLGAAAGTVSSSAQIATDISGSFTSVSSSLAARITLEEGEALFTAAGISGSFTSVSSSLAARITLEEAEAGGGGSFTAAGISGSWQSQNFSTTQSFSDGSATLISGSSTSTGSFGKVEVDTVKVSGGTNPAVDITNSGRLRLMRSTTSQNYFQLYPDSNGFNYLEFYNGAFRIAPAGGTKLIIHTNGHFGINTTTDAGFWLDVNGASRLTGDVTLGADISGSSTSTGSFGVIEVGGGHFTSASLAAGGGGGGSSPNATDGSQTKISGSSVSTGSFGRLETVGSSVIGGILSIPDIPDVSASLAAAVAGGDNLGNHTATQDLNLGSNSIKNILHVTASGHISGSTTSTGSFGKISINASGSATGSTLFSVANSDYELFNVSNIMTGSLFSVNTISGIPIIEAFSDSKVKLGPSSNPVEIDSVGNISLTGNVTASGHISGSTTSTGSFGTLNLDGGNFTSASLAAAAAAAGISNLVEDTTPQLGGDLDLNSKNIVGNGGIQLSGSLIISGSSSSPATTASLVIQDYSYTDTHVASQSSVVSVIGNNGSLFNVSDQMTGSLFSVSNVSGFPIIEAFSDNKVTLGSYSNPTIINSDGTFANVSGSSTSTGSFGRVEVGGTALGASPITALNNATENELVTVGSTTTELDGEANLTFDGSQLDVGSSGHATVHITGASGKDANVKLQNNSRLWIFQNDGDNTLAKGAGTLHLYDGTAGSTRIAVDSTGVVEMPAGVSGSSTSTGSFGAGFFDDRVGINEASPDTRLEIAGAHISGIGLAHIDSTDHAFIALDAAGASHNKGIYFQEAGVHQSILEHQGSENRLRIWDGSTTYVTIGDSTGDIHTIGDISANGNISGSATSTGSFGNVESPLNGRIIGNLTELIKVTVVSDGGNHYAFEGATTPSLQVSEGKIYRFDISDSTNGSHPFRLSQTLDGGHGGGSAYTTGVTVVGTQGQAGAYLELQVTKATANHLYYYCTAHPGMGNDGKIMKNDLTNLHMISGSSISSGSFGSLKIDGATVDFTGLPTSDPGVAGRLWNDSNTLKISAG